jgi:cytochrome c
MALDPAHRWRTALVRAALGAAILSPAVQAGDATRGAQLYAARCGACHSLDANGAGPMHRNVVGRTVASAPGYTYSDALRRQRFRWSPRQLDLWLADPNRLVPGNKMVVRLAPDPRDRADIIAFLTQN